MTPFKHCFYILVCLSVPLASSAQKPAAEPYRLGYPTDWFSHVNTRDTKVAFELWVKQMTADTDAPTEPSIHFFNNTSEAVRLIRADAIDLIALPVLDFLDIRDEVSLDPALVILGNNRIADEFVLLVRKDSGIQSLDQLEGLQLITTSQEKALRVSLMWLDNCLMKAELLPHESFFNVITEAPKTASAVLPVFFGQADACLVLKRLFDTMVELNPQLRNELAVLADSPPLLTSLTCFTPACSPRKRQRTLVVGERMHHTPKGRQILTLFGLSRAVPFQPEHLQSIFTLIREHKALTARLAAGASNAP